MPIELIDKRTNSGHVLNKIINSTILELGYCIQYGEELDRFGCEKRNKILDYFFGNALFCLDICEGINVYYGNKKLNCLQEKELLDTLKRNMEKAGFNNSVIYIH